MSEFIAFGGFYQLARVEGSDPPQFTFVTSFAGDAVELREATADPDQNGAVLPGQPIEIWTPGATEPFSTEGYVGKLEVGGVIVGVITQANETDYFLSTSDPALDTPSATITATQTELIYCFMEGTLIATPSGEVPVETLQPGDLVLTASGEAAPVRWVGRQTVSAPFADPLRTLPVRIAAGALGGGLPRRDLLVSPAHALEVDGVLAEAGALVNGSSIRRVPRASLPERFTYYHVELASHALLLAEGAPAESFVDNGSRQLFDNGAAERTVHGDAPVAELDLPRAAAARQVPAATRQRLAAIAARLGAAVADAA